MLSPDFKFVSTQLAGELNEGKKLESKVGATITGVATEDINQFCLELCLRVVQGELEASKVPVAIKCIGALPDSLSVSLCDVLWMARTQLGSPPDKEQVDALVGVVTELMKAGMITRQQLKETQELDFLDEAGAVPNKELWKKSEVRSNTQRVYNQRKFNLLREDNEGYAKLITLLGRGGKAALSPATLPAVQAELRSLIGFFDLDPNRVSDVVLTAYGQQPERGAFRELLQGLCEPASLAHLLGFQLRSRAPAGRVLHVAASLLAGGQLPVLALLPHLQPPDEELASAYAAAASSMTEQIKSIGKVNLAALDRSQKAFSQAKVLQATQLDADARPYAHTLSRALGGSACHKLGLIAALLDVGSWEHAAALMRHCRAVEVDAVADERVAQALAGLIGRECAELDAALRPQGRWGASLLDAPPGEAHPAGPPLSQQVFDMVDALGVSAFVSPRLLSRLCRVLQHELQFHVPRDEHGALELASPSAVAVQDALQNCLMPAAMLIPANPGLLHQLWCLLEVLPYTARFRLYSEVAQLAESLPLLRAAVKTSLQLTKKLMKYLSVPQDRRDRKEALKPFGRMLAMCTHACPQQCLTWLVSYVESYNNWIEPLCEALKYLSRYALDVLSYVILSAATSGRPKLNEDDGINISAWLVNLATFTGHVAKKCPGLELSAVCQYVAHSLRAVEKYDLILFKEIIGTMTGIHSVSDVSTTQVEALAGSDTLASEAMHFGGVRNNSALRRGQARLVEALSSPSPQSDLLLPLLLLIVQQRSIVAQEAGGGVIKAVAELYDRTQATLLQYIEFLQRALTQEQYAALLPSLKDLLVEFGVPAEIAYLLYRPIMRRIKGAAGESTEDGEVADAAMESTPAATDSWAAVMEEAKAGRPPAIWTLMPVSFYVNFWMLTLPDLHFPGEKYASTIASVREAASKRKFEAAVLEANLGGTVDLGGTQKTATEDDAAFARKERSRLMEVAEQLPRDRDEQQAAVAAVRERLVADAGWFDDMDVTEVTARTQCFVRECLVPRCTLTPADAVYCAKFIEMMQAIRVPNFSMLLVLDRIIQNMASMVSCMTDREAQNFAFFYFKIFELSNRWRSEEVFNAECAGSPGFSILHIKMKPSDTHEGNCTFRQWRGLSSKWQLNTANAIVSCWESGEVVATRNSLLLLSKIVPVFPIYMRAAVMLEISLKSTLEKLRARQLHDLVALTESYLPQLLNAMRDPANRDWFDFSNRKRTTERILAEKAPPAAASGAKADKAPSTADPDRTADAVTDAPKGKSGAEGATAAEADPGEVEPPRSPSGTEPAPTQKQPSTDSPARAQGGGKSQDGRSEAPRTTLRKEAAEFRPAKRRREEGKGADAARSGASQRQEVGGGHRSDAPSAAGSGGGPLAARAGEKDKGKPAERVGEDPAPASATSSPHPGGSRGSRLDGDARKSDRSDRGERRSEGSRDKRDSKTRSKPSAEEAAVEGASGQGSKRERAAGKPSRGEGGRGARGGEGSPSSKRRRTAGAPQESSRNSSKEGRKRR